MTNPHVFTNSRQRALGYTYGLIFDGVFKIVGHLHYLIFHFKVKAKLLQRRVRFILVVKNCSDEFTTRCTIIPKVS